MLLGSVLDFLVTNLLYLFSIYSLLNFPKKIKLSPFKALFDVSLTAYVGHWLILRRGKVNYTPYP
jgi:hypothetical protein